MGWFRRKDAESMDPQVLLAQANAATQFQQPSIPIGVATGFRMTVQDVFSITGRGTVVTGRIEAGTIATGSTVRLTRHDGATRDVEVSGIEVFRKKLDAASAGDNVGLLLRGIDKTDVAAGDVLSS
jgi:translation elongation factor EF-Tu-like GTPase